MPYYLDQLNTIKYSVSHFKANFRGCFFANFFVVFIGCSGFHPINRRNDPMNDTAGLMNEV